MTLKDITIKNVPDGAEDNVKELAAVAVERYYRKSVTATKIIINKFETDVDKFRTDNGLEKKFDIKEKI